MYDSKADVWSWGVLLVELVTCQFPYAHTYLTPVQIATAVLDEQLRPEMPSSAPIELQVSVLDMVNMLVWVWVWVNTLANVKVGLSDQ